MTLNEFCGFGKVCDEPLFLDEQLLFSLFHDAEVCTNATWAEVAARCLGCSIANWPNCLENNEASASFDDSLQMFPVEIWLQIAAQLSYRDAVALSTSCRETRFAVFNWLLFRVAETEFPDSSRWRTAIKAAAPACSWPGLVHCNLLTSNNTGASDNLRSWLVEARMTRSALFDSHRKSSKEIRSRCNCVARSGALVVAGCDSELVLFRNGAQSISAQSEACKLVAASHEYVCSFGPSDLNIFDSTLNELFTMTGLSEGVFAADVCGDLMAVAAGTELSLFDLKKGKVLLGKKPKDEEFRPAPPLSLFSEVQPPVASAKYVPAPPPEEADDDGAFLEIGRCVFLI